MDLPGSHSLPPDLSHITRQAASRWKLERVKAGLSRALAALAVVQALWVLLLVFKRSWIAPFPFAVVGALGLLAVIAAQGWLRRADPQTIHRGIDRRLRLPDMALSSGELPGDGTWFAQLRQQTLARIASADWSKVWPVPWPKWTRRSAFSCVAFFALLGYFYHADLEIRRADLARPVPRDARAAALETVFKDWEEAKPKDEELKKLLEKTAPLRDRLIAQGASEKQRFADLNRLEEIVAAEKAKLDAQSLEPQAANLADALASMEGMSALSAALRKKDFEKAADQARQAAEKLGAENAEVPKGAQEAGNAAQKLSEQLGKNGQQPISQSLSQFSQGAKQGDCKQMASGLNGMKQCLSQQSARNEERKRLATQLAQLSFCKNPGDSECKNGGMSFLPKLSLMKQKQPGKGAGSETDLNRFGAETTLASERHTETMNNTATEGESETTTTKSATGQTEAARGTRTVSFQEYQALSQQAIADEAIPAAHREAIKRYFERIRPEAGK
jgi:hypothetical protein